MSQVWGLGRRKSSVARVFLVPGKGQILINKKLGEDYFGGIHRLVEDLKSPFEITKTLGKYDIKVTVKGGGTTGQAGAIRLGVARALAKIDEANQKILRKAGFLTRDSRMVERKKPGKPKARKSFQFSKR
ncbi:MAG: 30S ribosomal protein S9 [bacterium]|nr:30S ribosomal protein S9 [bacterium]